jgi:hypothetical protein
MLPVRESRDEHPRSRPHPPVPLQPQLSERLQDFPLRIHWAVVRAIIRPSTRGKSCPCDASDVAGMSWGVELRGRGPGTRLDMYTVENKGAASPVYCFGMGPFLKDFALPETRHTAKRPLFSFLIAAKIPCNLLFDSVSVVC